MMPARGRLLAELLSVRVPSCAGPGPRIIRSMIGREAVFSVAALLISATLFQTIMPRDPATRRGHLAEPIVSQEPVHPGAPSATAPGTRPQPRTTLAPSQTAPAATLPATSLVFVILKDYEQEVALILATWALCLIGYQASGARPRPPPVRRELRRTQRRPRRRSRRRPPLRTPDREPPRDEQEMLLPRALIVGLNQFGATRGVKTQPRPCAPNARTSSTAWMHNFPWCASQRGRSPPWGL